MIRRMKNIALLLAIAVLCCVAMPRVHAETPVYGYTVVHTYPHDTGAFTEGLFYLDGYLYESTGLVGHSTIRKVNLKTGEVLQLGHTPMPDYGEGIVAWKHRLIQLTYQSEHGYIFDLDTFKQIGMFDYRGEGWALTHDGHHILMSDGTAAMRVLDPETLKQIDTINVVADGQPVINLNEIEYVKGQIYANVWLTNRIARIDPATGNVVGWIDLTGLGPKPNETIDPTNDVLNGIAYDAKHDRLFVTGKRWPLIYEILLTAPHAAH